MEKGCSSKELLHLERKCSSSNPSPLESTLLVCGKKKEQSQKKKPVMGPVPPSQVLGRVKDFLGVMSEANKQLQQDAKDNAQDYDIEVLTGDESEVIEMDLMLGIADLHTPAAVAAAESAISGSQPLVLSETGGTESEDTSDDDDDDDEEEEEDHTGNCDSDGKLKNNASDKVDEDNLSEPGHNRSRKRPKIIEMS